MIDDIIRYLEYLQSLGLSVSIHSNGDNLGNVTSLLGDRSVHSNPFCLYVKTKGNCWDTCLRQQKKVISVCGDELFFGYCYCGVGEYVMPIRDSDKLLGFISAGGYCGGEERLVSFAENNLCAPKEALDLYRRSLLSEVHSPETVAALLGVLKDSVILEYRARGAALGTIRNDYLYNHALLYIRNNSKEKIRIKDIAKFCHCSESHISHIFYKRKTTPNKELCHARIENSIKLLESTDMGISEIAYEVGFSDANYFSFVFKQKTGTSPLNYRKIKRKEKNNESN